MIGIVRANRLARRAGCPWAADRNRAPLGSASAIQQFRSIVEAAAGRIRSRQVGNRQSGLQRAAGAPAPVRSPPCSSPSFAKSALLSFHQQSAVARPTAGRSCTIRAGVLFNHTRAQWGGTLGLRAVVFDYGMVLTGPPDPEAHAAMLRITGLPAGPLREPLLGRPPRLRRRQAHRHRLLAEVRPRRRPQPRARPRSKS